MNKRIRKKVAKREAELREAQAEASAPTQGALHDGAGQQTVTGTCLQTTRGTQRLTVYGTCFSTHRGTWMVFV